MSSPAIQCKSVWKIFGHRPHEALELTQTKGIDKDELFRRTGCVIGVADVSFEVGRGEIFCVMGLSGSGKSTMVRHVNRLIEPTAGSIIIGGQDINALNKADLRRMRAEKIGMVFQHMALLPHRTVWDNVSMALELRGVDPAKRRQVAAEKLTLVGLDGWGDRYPDELSGGMKQRVGLARAMAADPEILLMDEPFSALDPLIRRQLQTQFIELSKIFHKTTIFITHDLDEAIRLGDRIAIMKNGRIVQVGTPEDIVTNPKDEYVAEFVAGISRVELVTAQKIMHPLNALSPAARADLATAPRAPAGATLHELINLACESDQPIVIVDGDTEAGVVDKRALLQGVLGGQAELDRAA
jgi:glycine betaine/proline transport system ATP-binding protein